MNILNSAYHICVYNRLRWSVDEVIYDLNQHVSLTKGLLIRNLSSISSAIYNKIIHWPYIIVTIHNNEHITDTAILKLSGHEYIEFISNDDDVRYIQRLLDIQTKRSYFKYEYNYENNFKWPSPYQEVNFEEYKFKALNRIELEDLRESNLIGIARLNNIVRCKPINTSFYMFQEDMFTLLNTVLFTKNGHVTGVNENADGTFDFYFVIDDHHPPDYDIISEQYVEHINSLISTNKQLLRFSNSFEDPFGFL